ncbi:hypothetical protein [Streptomyces flavofungini]|uniref:hypothetical protein n=1 Tax=Streptomyces flavofungini TaxID=68200 RepID=UPI0025B02816|nr:hypothetical protein [Streptomyces flavofungini]WJV46982.1 hypothetical protein QUY26_16485 [Streptomyces flavofungini]
MTRIRAAAAAGVMTCAAALTAIPSAQAAIPGAPAGPGDNGELVVSPDAVRPGQWVGLSAVNTELDEDNAVVESEVFTRSVRLTNPGKVRWKGRAKVRCDAEPGTYEVRFTESIPPDDAYGAKVRVETGGPAKNSGCAARGGGERGADGDDGDDGGVNRVALGLATGAGATVVVAGAFLAVRRGGRRA